MTEPTSWDQWREDRLRPASRPFVRWVFPCCQRKRDGERPMYPICPDHHQRAVFLEEIGQRLYR